jgi:hypothetical protein
MAHKGAETCSGHETVIKTFGRNIVAIDGTPKDYSIWRLNENTVYST